MLLDVGYSWWWNIVLSVDDVLVVLWFYFWLWFDLVLCGLVLVEFWLVDVGLNMLCGWFGVIVLVLYVFCLMCDCIWLIVDG